MNSDSTVRLLRTHFDNIQDKGINLVRAEKRYNGKTLSVHYFDFSEALIKENFDLRNYLQQSLASDYYKNEGSLQWNYYLYFVLDKDSFNNICRTTLLANVESDRTFARKFVKEQTELNRELDSPFVEALKIDKPSLDISSIWLEELKNAGLGKVANPSAEYAQTVRDYLEDTQEVAKNIVSLPTVANGQFIRNIRWSNYREYPKPGKFNFSAVNLIRGVNGTGKTSLLEAIELCICGGIRRQNGKAPTGIKLEVTYRDSQSPEQCPSKNMQIYRSRDQSWFGGYSRTGNNLFNNFGRFNFFNSDAAYQLSSSDEASEIQRAVDTLLLGESANMIEERMRNFSERFAHEERESARMLRVIRESVTTTTKQLEQLKAIKDTRPTLTEEFKSKAVACGWKKIPVKPTFNDLVSLQEAVDGVFAELEQNKETLWWMGRISPASIENEMKTVNTALVEIDSLREEANKNAIILERTITQLAKSEEELSILTRIREYHNEDKAMLLRGSSKVLEEARAKVSRLQEAANILLSIDLNPYINIHLTPAALSQKQSDEIREAQRNLHSLQIQLKPLQDRIGKINSLIQEIKKLGRQYCKFTSHSNNCPLCGARYDDLTARFESLEITAPDEESLRKLMEKTSQVQERLSKLETDADVFANIYQAGMLVFGQEKAANSHLEIIVNELVNLNEYLIKEEKVQEDLHAFTTRMMLAGFEEKEIDNLIALAHEKYSLPLTRITNKENFVSLFNEKSSQIVDLKKIRRDAERIQDQFQAKIEKIHTQYFRETEIEDRLVELVRRKESLKGVIEQVKIIKERIIIADDDDFAIVNKRLDMLSKTIARIQKAFRNIEEKDSLEQQLTTILSQTQLQVKNLTPRHLKAKNAVELLQQLCGNEYKEKYLLQLRSEHSNKVSNIFCRIHSPHEFKSVVLEENITLERLNGVRSKVSEISAGQRAALALSIFLSLNSSVTTRAPWLLFDDPVVHVDDMNVLSFFDTLRDLVLLDNRQVFFATASSRVSDLFAKKFDCLGSEFCEIIIKR